MTKAFETRMRILEKAFELIYANGYQATSIDDIIARTQVTKGAFFYHFKTKDEMGLAVITDLMTPFVSHGYSDPLRKENDPVKAIYAAMKDLLLENRQLSVRYGCPAGNLTQEMAPISAKFSAALNELISRWHDSLKTSINTGKKNGFVRKDVDASQVAYMVMSGYWGIRNFGKLSGNNSCYQAYLKELKRYLQSLR